MADMHVHIHFGYAPEKLPQVAEEEEPTPDPQAELAEQQLALNREQLDLSRKQLALSKQALADQRRPTKPPQAALVGREEMSDEDDKDREYRLMRTFTMGGTLTEEEFDFLKRRGLVRY